MDPWIRPPGATSPGATPLRLGLVILLFGISACCGRRGGQKESSPDEKVVARVNESVLRQEELDRAVQGYFGDAPPEEKRREYVEQWVEDQLLYQEAVREGLKSDEEVRQKISQFEQMLMSQEVLQRHLDGRVDVSDEEIADYYEANKELFVCGEDEYRLAKLIFPDEEMVMEVAGELQVAPERYDELVGSGPYAEAITVVDLGYYPVSEIEADFGDLAEGLKPGKISQPVSAYPGNPCIIRAVAFRKKGAVREPEEVAEQIRNVLVQEKRERERGEWIEELRRNAKIVMPPEAEMAGQVEK